MVEARAEIAILEDEEEERARDDERDGQPRRPAGLFRSTQR